MILILPAISNLLVKVDSDDADMGRFASPMSIFAVDFSVGSDQVLCTTQVKRQENVVVALPDVFCVGREQNKRELHDWQFAGDLPGAYPTTWRPLREVPRPKRVVISYITSAAN
jgi:hypothetical protein